MTIHSFPRLLIENLSIPWKESFQTIGHWTGRAIEWIKDLPSQMQNNPRTALAVFLTANLLFFTLINSCANALDERVNSSPQTLSSDDRKFNAFLIDGVVTGGSVLVFNLILSKLMNYPLSKSAYVAITVTAIAIRTLFFSTVRGDEIDDSDEIDEDSQEESDFSVESDEQQSPREVESVQAEQAEETTQTDITKAQQQTFIHGMCQEIEELLNKFCQNIDFNDDQRNAQKNFLEQLKQGVATIEDTGDICRAANVPIQAAFEYLLAKKLAEGKLKQGKVIFLTGLPCTPLRTPIQKIDKNVQLEWKKWTVDVRTQTVRELRNKGATVFVSYNAADYQKLPESPKGQIEFNTYEVEKNAPYTTDLPLSSAIPKELIGALYFFNDQEGNRYILATQGIQIQHHGEIPKECWKIWFGAEDTEANIRAQEMVDFIDSNCSEDDFATTFGE